MDALRAQLTLEHAKDIKRLEAQLARDSRKIQELQDATQQAEKLRKEASELPSFIC